MNNSLAAADASDAGVFFSAHEMPGSTAARMLSRAAERGTLVRITRGAYFDAARWRTLFPEDKHHMLVLATAHLLSRDAAFSHESAAALLGIRMLGPWPRRPIITADPTDSSRSTPTLRRVHRALDTSELVRVGGVLCTSPARTLADLASDLPFANAVAAADSALHRKRPTPLVTLDEFALAAQRLAGQRGHKKVQRVVAFATPLSDSVQESRSRVLIHELGFPAPVLQQPWRDSFGYIGETDFWWPDYMVAGEFDGLVKYLDREMRGKRTPEQVLIAEKRREDRIRRQGITMARWVTKELDPPSRLRTILLEAGLPLIP